MIIDGKKMASLIKADLARQATGRNLCLGVIQVGDNPVSSRYVARKQQLGEEIGVAVQIFEFPAEITETDLMSEVEQLAERASLQGLIIQLPLPVHLNETKILNLIPPAKDVDALGSDPRVLNPTVSAIREILAFGQVKLAGRAVVVLGRGKLVGRPAAIWLTQEGALVEVISSQTVDPAARLILADIIVSGVGKTGLIKPTMIKDGVVLVDAGTSESGGQLRGDADPACAEKCALFTPVPGGVGPLTVAMLFKNLLELNRPPRTVLERPLKDGPR